MKLFFFCSISKFNALMALGILSLTTISLPVTAANQEAFVNTSTGYIGREGLVSELSIAKTQKTERVRFGKGKTSTTLTRTIPGNGAIEFIANAKKGQTMDFTVGYDFKDSDVQLLLLEPELREISLISGPKKPNEFAIRMTGDHYLNVTNTTGKKIKITLYLDIN